MNEETTGCVPATGLPTLDSEDVRPPAPPAPLPGAIGGFPILSKLGEGGMGIVYEAEQQSPRRRVALKVVRGGRFVSEEDLRMFRREAETLARLSHPNIAAIYEAGRTEDGQHFFTMELVRGRTLSGWARERLGGERPGPEAVKERLRLFGTICRAVSYAHQRGVIHRDLKPSNLIVSETGEVKVLDFGLARITDTDVAVGTIVTELGAIRGTLPYMSPEQARGDSREIDFRTDVYSLGVLLYQLVSGQHPYDTQAVSLVHAVRTICEAPPRPLREAAGGTAVDADLETIVAKALQKEPDQRYQSAAALAEDVERYLAGEPILAHPPSTIYQLRKLAARNKGGVAAVGAIALLVVALAVTMAVQAQRVRRERDRAAVEAAKASAINAFLQEALGAADPWGKGSRNVTLLEALKQARARVETAFRGQPLVEAAVLRTIGTTLSSLAEFEEAEPALKRALELQTAAAGRTSDDVAASLEALTGLYESWRKYDESEKAGKEAYEIRRALHGRESLEAAASLAIYATPVRRKGRLDEAKRDAEEALRIARARAADGGAETEAATRVEDEALNQLNFIATERQDWAASEKLASVRVAALRARYPGGHPQLAGALNDLAVAVLYRKDLPRAEALFKEAIAMGVATLGEDHPETASYRENLGNVYYQLGRLDETARTLSAVLAVRRRVLGDDSEAVARTFANMGSVQKKAGQVDAAARSFEEAVPRFEKIFGPEHPDLGTALFGLADTRRLQKRFPESEALYLRALAIQTKAIGETGPMTQFILKGMTLLYTDWGRPEKADACRARMVPPAPVAAAAAPAAR